MNERMLGAVVSAVLAVERGDTEAFNLLMAQAPREDPRGFVMAALGTVWRLANELAQAKGTTTREVLEDLALLAAEGEGGLFDLPGEGLAAD
jgi:hypothetical protein